MKRQLFAALSLLAIFGMGNASASLIGNTVDITTSQAGTVTIAPSPGPFARTVVDPGAEFSFCIGPNANNCVTSGLFGEMNIGADRIDFTFFGSTFGATGSFDIAIDDFDNPIVNVSLLGGSLVSGSFGLLSFDSDTITFRGVPSGNFSAIGGRTISFQVEHVPEPPSLALLGLGLAALGYLRRRR